MKAAVLGSPIAHSLSPSLHRAAYEALGLADWTYDAIEVTEAGLGRFLDGLGPEWAGLSLTMPLKTAVLPMLDEMSAQAATTGSVNTVLLRDGRRTGENTDVAGLQEAFDRAGVDVVDEAVLLGGGATARSAVAALAGSTRQVKAYVRDPERARPLRTVATAYGLDLEVLRWGAGVDLAAPLVVNTTPPGVADVLAGSVRGGGGVLVEVVYDPWPTRLAQRWLDAGGAAVDGRVMLVGQAVEQVRLMTGSRVPPESITEVMERTFKIG